MIYLYFAFLLVALFIAFFLNGKDIISPTVITILTFLIGSIFSIIGSLEWNNSSLSFVTILVVLLSIVSMECGELLVRKCTLRKKNKLSIKPLPIKIPLYLHLLLLAVSFLSVYLYYKRITQIAISQGYSGSLFLNYVRMGINEGGQSIGYLITILTSFSKSLGYICIFVFIRNLILYKKKTSIFGDFVLLIQSAPLIVLLYLASSRYAFLKLIVYIFVCTFLLLFKYKAIKFKIKHFAMLSIGGLLFLFAFYGIYTLMGSSRGSFSTFTSSDKFTMYAGSSIFGLDSYIKGGMKSSSYFGEETLVGLYSLINRFAPDFPTGTRFLEAYPLGGGLTSNVYIMVRSLIADYSFIGMVLIEFAIGLVFTAAYYKVRYYSRKEYLVIVYSYFCYGLVFQLFAPLMISDLFSISQILELFMIAVLISILKKRALLQNKYKHLLVQEPIVFKR